MPHSRNKPSKRTRAKEGRAAKHRLAAYACLGPCLTEPKRAQGWASDLAELADRIQREGVDAVPNRDRDLLARNLPLGSLTNRHGESVRPVYSDLANV